MTDPYRKSPMLGGTLICLGGVLMVMGIYFLFDDVADKTEEAQWLLFMAGLGYLLWIGGSTLLARARFSSALAGFLCGVLLVPGLIVLLTMVPTRSRQEIWREANPGFSVRQQNRQYRNLKSLH